MSIIQRVKNNHILAITIGLVYLWFGALKFFPGLSPAEELAGKTVCALTLGLIPEGLCLFLLAVWEVAVGILLILNIQRKKVVLLTLVHMVFTFSPYLIFPEQSFTVPFAFTLVGQYIFKNIIIIAALVMLYRTTQPGVIKAPVPVKD